MYVILGQESFYTMTRALHHLLTPAWYSYAYFIIVWPSVTMLYVLETVSCWCWSSLETWPMMRHITNNNMFWLLLINRNENACQTPFRSSNHYTVYCVSEKTVAVNPHPAEVDQKNVVASSNQAKATIRSVDPLTFIASLGDKVWAEESDLSYKRGLYWTSWGEWKSSLLQWPEGPSTWISSY